MKFQGRRSKHNLLKAAVHQVQEVAVAAAPVVEVAAAVARLGLNFNVIYETKIYTKPDHYSSDQQKQFCTIC